MLALYLFCLIVGGGLLAFTLFGADADGSDSFDAEHGGDFELEADQGGDFELDAGGDAVALDHVGGADPGGGLEHHGGWDPVRDFLSIRSLFYFLAGFGATGLLLDVLTAASTSVALVWAIATGLVAAFLAGSIYGWLRRSESGAVSREHDYLVGKPARVVLPVVAGRRGKVRLLSGEREVVLLARLYSGDDPDCARGSTVVIVEIEGDTALVTPAPSLPSESFQE